VDSLLQTIKQLLPTRMPLLHFFSRSRCQKSLSYVSVAWNARKQELKEKRNYMK